MKPYLCCFISFRWGLGFVCLLLNYCVLLLILDFFVLKLYSLLRTRRNQTTNWKKPRRRKRSLLTRRTKLPSSHPRPMKGLMNVGGGNEHVQMMVLTNMGRYDEHGEGRGFLLWHIFFLLPPPPPDFTPNTRGVGVGIGEDEDEMDEDGFLLDQGWPDFSGLIVYNCYGLNKLERFGPACQTFRLQNQSGLTLDVLSDRFQSRAQHWTWLRPKWKVPTRRLVEESNVAALFFFFFCVCSWFITSSLFTPLTI